MKYGSRSYSRPGSSTTTPLTKKNASDDEGSKDEGEEDEPEADEELSTPIVPHKQQVCEVSSDENDAEPAGDSSQPKPDAVKDCVCWDCTFQSSTWLFPIATGPWM